MIRALATASLFILVGCADQSKGAALGECRLKHYLDNPAAQGKLIPDCMSAKSFQMIAACSPAPNEHEWDWQVRTFAYDDPKCYQPLGSTAWIATALSPM